MAVGHSLSTWCRIFAITESSEIVANANLNSASAWNRLACAMDAGSVAFSSLSLSLHCYGHATPFKMEQTPSVDDNYETVKLNIDIWYDKNNNNKTQTTTSEDDNGSNKCRNKSNRMRKHQKKKLFLSPSKKFHPMAKINQ